MPRDVFISHSSRSSDLAGALCTALEARGFSCWIAPRDLEPGAEWAEGIITGIENSRLFLLVLCRHANESPQVLREVERAVHKRIPIIPFLADRVELSKSLEYFVSSHQWIDAVSRPLEPHVEVLAAAMGRYLKRPPADSGPAPAPPAQPPARRRSGLRAALPALIGALAVLAWFLLVMQPEKPAPPPPGPQAAGPRGDWPELAAVIQGASFPVEITANKNAFEVGDPLVVTCRVPRSGHLFVFSQTEGDKRVTRLFPNQQHPDNFVEAGVTVTIPGPDDTFTLVADENLGRTLLAAVLAPADIPELRGGDVSGPFADLPASNMTRGFAVRPETPSEHGAGWYVSEVVGKD